MRWFDKLVGWLVSSPETWDDAAARCQTFENEAMHSYHEILSVGEDPESPRAYEKLMEATKWARRRRVFEEQARRNR